MQFGASSQPGVGVRLRGDKLWVQGKDSLTILRVFRSSGEVEVRLRLVVGTG